MSPRLPLLIATDENLLFAAATMLRSAQASLASGFELDVYAYLEGVSDEETARFCGLFTDERGRSPRVITDATLPPDDQQRMERLVATLPKFPRALWARLFLPGLVEDAERAVFSDVDVAVIQDLSALWTVPLEGQAVGAVRDAAASPMEQLRTRYPHVRSYFNAGVMTIDVEKWRAERVAERTVDWLLDKGRKSYFPDQDGLNLILTADDGTPLWQEIDPVWNVISNPRRVVRWPDGTERPVGVDEVRLRHFAGSYKPWNTEQLGFKDVFDRHLATVPFEVPPHLRKRSRPSLVRRSVRRIRRAFAR